MGSAVSFTSSSSSGFSRKGVRYDEKGRVQDCLFCQFVRGDAKPGRRGNGEILYETKDTIVFEPRDPYARRHLLVVSKRHVRHVKDSSNSLELMRSLKEAGEDALNEIGAEKEGRFYRFHLSPFNSIDHLHLHCFQGQFYSIFGTIKYGNNGIWGLSWTDAERFLRRRQRSKSQHHDLENRDENDDGDPRASL